MNIVYSFESVYPLKGGAEKTAKTIVEWFAKKGHNCYILYKRVHPRRYIDIKGCKIVSVKDRRAVGNLCPDVFLTQLERAPIVVNTAKILNIPSILFLPSYEHITEEVNRLISFMNNGKRKINKTALLSQKQKGLLMQANIVIANSKATASIYNKFLKRDYHIVYPPIDFKECKIKRTNAKKRKGFIAMVCSNRFKGGDVFLKIAKLLPEFNFLCIENKGYSVSKGRRRLPSNIKIEGWQDIKDIFKKTKLMLIPSQWPEPFGRIAPEAVSNGIPVLASKCGGLPEAVGLCEYLVEDYTNPKAWVEAILKHFKRPYKEKVHLIKKAKQYCDRFDKSRIMPQLEEAIMNLIYKKRKYAESQNGQLDGSRYKIVLVSMYKDYLKRRRHGKGKQD